MKTVFVLSNDKQIVILPANTIVYHDNHDASFTEDVLVIVAERHATNYDNQRQCKMFIGDTHLCYIDCVLAVDSLPGDRQYVVPRAWPIERINEFKITRSEGSYALGVSYSIELPKD